MPATSHINDHHYDDDDDDNERRPLLSSSNTSRSATQGLSTSDAHVTNTSSADDGVNDDDDDDKLTSSFSCRQCLSTYVPIEPLLLGYAFCRILVIVLTGFYFFDQASRIYGDPSMSSLNPCGANATGGHPADKKRAESVQKESLQLTMIGSFSVYMTALLPTLFLGPLTDRIGRRMGFVLPLLGIVLRAIVILFVLGTGASHYFVYVGTVLEGLGGGFGCFLMTTFSTAADVTNPGSQRALRICIIEAVNVLGSAVANFIAGQWRQVSYTQPVMLAAAVGVVSLIFALWGMPETHSTTSTSTAPALQAAHNSRNGRASGPDREGDEERRPLLSSERKTGGLSTSQQPGGHGGDGGSGHQHSSGPRDLRDGAERGGQAHHPSSGEMMGRIGINDDVHGGSLHHHRHHHDGDAGAPGSSRSGDGSAHNHLAGDAYFSFSPTGHRLSSQASGVHQGTQGQYPPRGGDPAAREGTIPEASSPSLSSPVPVEASATSAAVDANRKEPPSSSGCLSCLVLAVGRIRKSWGVYFRVDDTSHPARRCVLLLCFVSFLLTVAVNFSKPSVETVFRQAQLCWNAVKESEFDSGWLVQHWVFILAFLHVAQGRLKVRDVYVAMVGCASALCAPLLFSIATLPDLSERTANIFVFVSAGSGTLARTLIPMLRSMSSAVVNLDEQGALFASYACVELAGAALFDMAASQIYKATIDVWKGIIFVIMTFFFVFVMILLIILSVVQRRARIKGHHTDRRSLQSHGTEGTG